MVRIELPSLAKEVCRIQTIQLYAGNDYLLIAVILIYFSFCYVIVLSLLLIFFVVSTSAIPFSEKALKLEAMVGNLEDSVFTIVRQTSTKKSFLGLSYAPNFKASPNMFTFAFISIMTLNYKTG